MLSDLTYVIIGAREDSKWIFVRHKERNTWELPAGHIEMGESVLEAAKRELFEETGVVNASICAIRDYSVTIDKDTLNGRIFFADIIDRQALPDSEIAEIILSRKSPESATYPYAHWKFMDVLESHILGL